MVIKMMVIIVLKKVLQKRRLLVNVAVRRRMTVTVMKTGKEPRRVQRKLVVYVFIFHYNLLLRVLHTSFSELLV